MDARVFDVIYTHEIVAQLRKTPQSARSGVIKWNEITANFKIEVSDPGR